MEGKFTSDCFCVCTTGTSLSPACLTPLWLCACVEATLNVVVVRCSSPKLIGGISTRSVQSLIPLPTPLLPTVFTINASVL